MASTTYTSASSKDVPLRTPGAMASTPTISTTGGITIGKKGIPSSNRRRLEPPPQLRQPEVNVDGGGQDQRDREQRGDDGEPDRQGQRRGEARLADHRAEGAHPGEPQCRPQRDQEVGGRDEQDHPAPDADAQRADSPAPGGSDPVG